MIVAAVAFVVLLALVLALVVALPQGSLPVDHRRDVPPITGDEMRAADDVLDAIERGQGAP